MSDSIRVMLARNWFGPDGVRYRAHPEGTLIPAKYEHQLPTDAEAFEQVPAEKPLPKPARRGGKAPKMTNAPAKVPKTLAEMGKADLVADTLSEMAKKAPESAIGGKS